MQTLVFNTTDKTTNLYDGISIEDGIIISEYSFDDVSTVSVREGYYEIMKMYEINTRTKGKIVTIPVARFPISQTNMIIINKKNI